MVVNNTEIWLYLPGKQRGTFSISRRKQSVNQSPWICFELFVIYSVSEELPSPVFRIPCRFAFLGGSCKEWHHRIPISSQFFPVPAIYCDCFTNSGDFYLLRGTRGCFLEKVLPHFYSIPRCTFKCGRITERCARGYFIGR